MLDLALFDELAFDAAPATGTPGINGSAAGGLRAGGSATARLAIAAAASGALLLGGAASARLPVAGAAAGGLRLGGTAAATLPLRAQAAGGLRVGGAAAIGTPELQGAASGGLRVGGAAAAALRLRASATGALRLGGAATVTTGGGAAPPLFVPSWAGRRRPAAPIATPDGAARFGARDLARIYAHDPAAVPIVAPAPGEPAPDGVWRARGFPQTGVAGEFVSGPLDGLEVPVGMVLLRVLAGSIGDPAPDTILQVGEGPFAARLRLVAERTPVGAGHEELLVCIPEAPLGVAGVAEAGRFAGRFAAVPFGEDDLARIYAHDPAAVPIATEPGTAEPVRRTRGFVRAGAQHRAGPRGGSLQIPVGTFALRILAGTLGDLLPDTILVVGGPVDGRAPTGDPLRRDAASAAVATRVRLVHERTPVGDGLEEDLVVVRERTAVAFRR